MYSISCLTRSSQERYQPTVFSEQFSTTSKLRMLSMFCKILFASSYLLFSGTIFTKRCMRLSVLICTIFVCVSCSLASLPTTHPASKFSSQAPSASLDQGSSTLTSISGSFKGRSLLLMDQKLLELVSTSSFATPWFASSSLRSTFLVRKLRSASRHWRSSMIPT